MSFTTDRQTLADLDVFGTRGKQSIYTIFNHTQTNGGALLLEEMFRYPLGDADSINRRSEMIRYLYSLDIAFPLQPALVEAAEKYLDNTDARSKLNIENDNLRQKFRNIVGADVEQQLIVSGIEALFEILHSLRDFLSKIPGPITSLQYKGELAEMHAIIAESCWQVVYDKKREKKISFTELVELDKLFRFTRVDMLKVLFHYIYTIDVFMAVASVAVSQKMVFANALSKGDNSVKLKNVYHPFLKDPVANSINISKERNIVFLTGANMAGKSTFMKSVGIALFLGHMGFPVPAEEMQFTVFDGILTTINLSDNLHSGYSHFYAEVLRVKKMAEQVKMGKNVFIIFDELFRGTNVKDAYEATVAITGALANKTNCMFMISTHIMEAGETLKQQYKLINFVFLPTKMEGDKPVYTFRLKKGISDDRHGMLIIKNENILNILKKGIIKSN